MLSDQQRAIVYFNPTNQLKERGQARSLAASVPTYAKNIGRRETLGGMVERIAAKRVSLEIQPGPTLR